MSKGVFVCNHHKVSDKFLELLKFQYLIECEFFSADEVRC